MTGNGGSAPDWSRYLSYSLAETLSLLGIGGCKLYCDAQALIFEAHEMLHSILFLVAASLFAQQSPVPEIRYRSVPDSELPPILYFRKLRGGSQCKGHVFFFSAVAIRRGRGMGEPGAALELARTASSARDRHTYAWSYAHTQGRSEEQVWLHKVRTWSIKSPEDAYLVFPQAGGL